MMATNNLNWVFIRGVLLNSEYIPTMAHMAFIYGDFIEEVLILTKDDMVYSFIYNKNKSLQTMKIETMCKKNIKTFMVGDHIISALTNTGKVYCWDRETVSSSPPVEVEVDGQFVVDVCSKYWLPYNANPQSNYYCALSKNGEIFYWTYYDKNISHPVKSNRLSILPRFRSISCGNSHSVAVTIDGRVNYWDYKDWNTYSDSYDRYIAPYIITLPNNVSIVKAVCGYEHTLALSDSGTLYVWGSNSCGELGINIETKKVSSPIRLENDEMGTVLDVAALSYARMSVAMGQSGNVFIWGACMGNNISRPFCCNLKSLSTALLHYSSVPPKNTPLILNEKQQTTVASYLQEAFDDPTTSDLIMEVHGKPIHVHKAILRVRSQYFRTMFLEHWKENDQNVIPHDQFSYDVYKGYLNYLYTDKINLPDIDKNITELMKLADTYNEISLLKGCKNVFINQLTPENVMIHYNAAVEGHYEGIQNCCIEFALNNLAEVVKTSSFMELEASVMKPFIIKVAQNNGFQK